LSATAAGEAAAGAVALDGVAILILVGGKILENKLVGPNQTISGEQAEKSEASDKDSKVTQNSRPTGHNLALFSKCCQSLQLES
jgi:hypothetical protein